MRLNLGIRRRLAPLLDGDRRKIELVYSILFSLPGSPILYYGDEVGMGDNIGLNDRDGLRSLMLREAGPHAGFSGRDVPPERLYAPATGDKLFGYQTVNVVAQRADPKSLVHKRRRMIAVRKQHLAFSQGGCEFVLNMRERDRPMKAKAAITDGKGRFSIADIEVSEPWPEEVLVEVQASGVCHTDWDSLSWGSELVLGHEGAGVIRAVGSAVRHVKIGDRVLLNWAISCGSCFQCMAGNHVLCENYGPVAKDYPAGHAHFDGTQWQGKPIRRSFKIGTMSSLTLVRREAVVKIEVDIPSASAAIVGCGVMTGYGSVVNAAKVQPGTVVVVIGCGGVGLSVIQGARISGAEKIIAVDLNETRLQMAKKFGATHTLLSRREDIHLLQAAEEVKQLTEGRGADYAFECTAVPALGASPLAMVRHAGTAIQVSGIEQDLTIDMKLFEWDKVYLNPLYGKCTPHIDFPRLFRLYAKGDLLLDEMVTRTYPLEQLGQAFDDLRQGINAKGVLIFDN